MCVVRSLEQAVVRDVEYLKNLPSIEKNTQLVGMGD